MRSQLPRTYSGIGPDYSKIIAIDAGNCTDVYQFVDFVRQYGLEIKKVLRNIVVSRVFTIYQLAHLIIYELPRIVEQLETRVQILSLSFKNISSGTFIIGEKKEHINCENQKLAV